MAKGTLPATHALHGILLVIAGLLLFLPGLITDSLGFLLLIPAIRELLIEKIAKLPRNAPKEVVLEAEIIDEKPKIRH